MKLYEIGTIITGNTPSRKIKEYYKSNDIMFIKPGDIEEKYITNLKKSEDYISEKARNKARILPKGTVLVTCIGTIGKVGILENEATCNQQINAIIPNDMIISKYLAYLIKSKQRVLKLKANAPVVPIINKTDFSKIEINICDREEQKKIVKKLDLTKKIIDIRKKQIEELRNFIKSQFVEMFELEKYELEMLGGISNFIDYRGKTPTISDDKEVRIVNAKSVGKGFFKYIDEYITEDLYEKWMKRGVAYAGDVLFVTEGHTFGNTCLIPDGIERFALGQRVITIQGKEKLNNIYLCYYMQLDEFINKINIYKTGGTAKGIRSKDLAKITIPVPPITLQNQFSEIVKQIDKQKFESMIQLKMMEKIYNIINDRRRYV